MMEGDEMKRAQVIEGVIEGEEGRAGNSCCGEEQMVLRGVVMAVVPAHPSH